MLELFFYAILALKGSGWFYELERSVSVMWKILVMTILHSKYFIVKH